MDVRQHEVDAAGGGGAVGRVRGSAQAGVEGALDGGGGAAGAGGEVDVGVACYGGAEGALQRPGDEGGGGGGLDGRDGEGPEEG